MLKTALHYSHDLLKEIIMPGDVVVDATVGNGLDTLFLAELVGQTGRVYGFDVQDQALATTAAKLEATGLAKQVRLLHQGHETASQVLAEEPSIKAGIFNLGYLPKSDKTIITQSDTTLLAIESLLHKLAPQGRLIIVIYYGHEGGDQEKNAVLDYVMQISQKEFNVLSYQFINQKNSPPILIAIEKKT